MSPCYDCTAGCCKGASHCWACTVHCPAGRVAVAASRRSQRFVTNSSPISSVVSSKVGGYCAGGQLVIITSHVQSSPDPRCTESWTSFFAIKLRAPGSKLSCPCFPFCMLILISSCNLRKPSRFSCATFWRSAACTPSQTPSEAEMTRPVPPLAKHLDLS